MQMPRPVGLVHAEDLHEEDAAVPGGGQPPQGALRRRRQGDSRQRRPELHAGGRDHQAAGQDGPGVLRGVSPVLPAQRHAGVVRHPGQDLQRHLAGGGGLRHPLLRQGLRHAVQGSADQL